MTLQEIAAHFAYTEWANARTFAAAATLAPDELNRDLGSSFRTIRDTIAHIVSGEWVWLSRWQGVGPTAHPGWVVTSTLDELRARLDGIERDRAAFLAGLTEADLARPLAFQLFNGTADAQPLIAQLLHIVNHSTYHRGQVAGMMRQVGAKAVSTDLIAYVREKT